MLSPPATMNFKTGLLRPHEMDYKRLTNLYRATATTSDLMILSKTLNIQTAAECAKLGMEEFLGNYSPTSELPRRDSRYSGPLQHSISLVGNHSHRVRQLHLLDVV